MPFSSCFGCPYLLTDTSDPERDPVEVCLRSEDDRKLDFVFGDFRICDKEYWESLEEGDRNEKEDNREM